MQQTRERASRFLPIYHDNADDGHLFLDLLHHPNDGRTLVRKEGWTRLCLHSNDSTCLVDSRSTGLSCINCSVHVDRTGSRVEFFDDPEPFTRNDELPVRNTCHIFCPHSGQNLAPAANG